MAVINAFSAFNVIAAGLDEAVYIVPIGKTYAIGDLTICPHNYNGPTRYDTTFTLKNHLTLSNIT